jgi:hypothetical protein
MMTIPKGATLMDIEREIHALEVETLALNYVLTQALFRMSRLSPEVNRAIAEAFDDAADVAQSTAVYLGKSAPAQHTVKVLRVVEEMRAVVFGDQNKPKHAV